MAVGVATAVAFTDVGALVFIGIETLTRAWNVFFACVSTS